jgi:acetyl esterase/lipase
VGKHNALRDTAHDLARMTSHDPHRRSVLRALGLGAGAAAAPVAAHAIGAPALAGNARSGALRVALLLPSEDAATTAEAAAFHDGFRLAAGADDAPALAIAVHDIGSGVGRALAFARRGYVVFNVNYRLAPAHRFPAAIADVCHAYAFALESAARFGADPSRVVVAGESAGANLATSLTLATTFERPEPFAKLAFDTGIVPRAVVPACGIFQVTDTARFARRKQGFSRFVAERLREVETGYLGPSPTMASLDLADPLCFFERGPEPARPVPPFFLPVGTKDPLLDDTRRLARALRAMGVSAEEEYYPGEIHAFHAFVMRAAARKCWGDTFAFLARHGIGPERSHEPVRRTPDHHGHVG